MNGLVIYGVLCNLMVLYCIARVAERIVRSRQTSYRVLERLEENRVRVELTTPRYGIPVCDRNCSVCWRRETKIMHINELPASALKQLRYLMPIDSGRSDFILTNEIAPGLKILLLAKPRSVVAQWLCDCEGYDINCPRCFTHEIISMIEENSDATK